MIPLSACPLWQADQLGPHRNYPVIHHASYTTQWDTIRVFSVEPPPGRFEGSVDRLLRATRRERRNPLESSRVSLIMALAVSGDLDFGSNCETPVVQGRLHSWLFLWRRAIL
jgi:hypothetical protein